MKKIITLAVILTLGIFSLAVGGDTFSPFHHDMHALGMGDAFVAHGSNANAFLYNPALLTRIDEFKLSIADLQVSVNTEFMDVINYMKDNKDSFDDWDSLTATEKNELLDGMQDFDDRWVTAGGYPSANLVLPMGVGFAVYDNLQMKVRLDRGIWEPRGYADLKNDLVFVAGYAREINPRLAVGGNIKFISRRTSGAIKLNASQFGDADDIFDEVEDSLRSAKTGMGIDIGALYSLKPNLDVGASIADFIGSIDGNKIPINFRAGVAYHYTGGFVQSGFLKEIIFAGDIEDLFNRDGDHLFNKMHLGADFIMPVLSLRFGFNQGYPGFGAGLDLKFLKLDYVYMGRELGSAPGRDSEYSHYAQLKLGFM